MTASFDSLTTIANDSGFQNRCLYALTVAAVNVMAEAVATASHDARAAYARRVIAGDVSGLLIARTVLTNSTIATEANASASPDFAIPDGDIQFTVNSLFNSLAGIAAQS